MTTDGRTYELRIDMVNMAGNRGSALYSNFSISDSSDYYRLHVDAFLGGNAGIMRTRLIRPTTRPTVVYLLIRNFLIKSR